MEGINRAEGPRLPQTPIKGDVPRELVEDADFIGQIFADQDNSADVADYVGQMSRRELNLKHTGHTATRRVPHGETARRIGNICHGTILSATKAHEGAVLRGREQPQYEIKRKGRS